jgi:hypothetical protein
MKKILTVTLFLFIPIFCAHADTDYTQILTTASTTGTDYFNLSEGAYLLTLTATTTGGSIYWEVYDTARPDLGWRTVEIFTSEGTYLGEHAGGYDYHYRARLDPDGSNNWTITAEH